MKQIVLLLILLLTCSFRPSILLASSIEVSGPVAGPWTADTVWVTGDVIVESGDQLTIGQGTLVLFTGHFRFTVRGSVIATGTATNPVRFSIQDTTGFADTLSASGGWHGFIYEHLAAATDSSLFICCLFEYGKAFSADTFGMYGGAFRIFDFSKIAFRECAFYNNFALRWGGAVYANNSDISFISCTFNGNRCGLSDFPWGYGGGLCSVKSEPVVVACRFERNSATGYGGGASFEYSDPELHHNVFFDNFGGLAGGFGFLRSAPAHVVTNNLVYGNTARFFGGGVACNRASVVFSNNTIVDNASIYGGGFYCNDSAVPLLYNTIIRGNSGFGHEVYIWDVRSAPSFFWCNIEGDTTDFEGSGAHLGFAGLYENNMDQDALFRNAGDFPYALQPGSPCVDSGAPDTSGLQVTTTDLEGLDRIYNGRIDIGAFERNPGQGIIFPDQKAANLTVFPNPATDQATFVFLSGTPAREFLRVINMHGAVVFEKHDIPLHPGSNSISVPLSTQAGDRISPGLYFCLTGSGSCTLLIK